MRNRIGICIAVALGIWVSAPIASIADGRRPPGRGISRKAVDSESFSISGAFSGALRGDILVDSVVYRLAPTAVVYEIGRGLVPLGTAFGDRVVILTGQPEGGAIVVYSVIVRPGVDRRSAGDGESPDVHVKAEGSPE